MGLFFPLVLPLGPCTTNFGLGGFLSRLHFGGREEREGERGKKGKGKEGGREQGRKELEGER